jgi:hypothetical protein
MRTHYGWAILPILGEEGFVKTALVGKETDHFFTYYYFFYFLIKKKKFK